MKLQKSIGEQCKCSVCNKTFLITEETCYIINGGYTCSWQCFLDEYKRRDKEKKERGKK